MKVICFKIWLPGSYASLWRKIWVEPDDNTLHDLANLIVDAFDFDHDHLYEFILSKQVSFFHPEAVETDGPKRMRADKLRLSQLNLELKQRFTFLYDFGDEWHFQVRVEGRMMRGPGIDKKGDPPHQYQYEEDENNDAGGGENND